MKEEDYSKLKSDIEKFLPSQNRLAYYYNQVFDIQIITAMTDNLKLYKDMLNNMNKIENLSKNQRKFYIIIRDNNKKIFKYKMIKCYIDWENFIKDNERKENIDFDDLIYYSIDNTLCNYCLKHKYLTTEKTLKKNQKINQEYQDFLKSLNSEQK